MARGSATRRKVPPISPSSDYYDDTDSAYAPSDEGRSGVSLRHTRQLDRLRNRLVVQAAILRHKTARKAEKQTSCTMFV